MLLKKGTGNMAEQWCVSCGKYIGYGNSENVNAQCKNCRPKDINYPIPKWIIFSGIILLVLVIYQYGNNFSEGLEYRRNETLGNEAFENELYLTAMNRYEALLMQDKLYMEDNAKLYISYVENYEYDKAIKLFDKKLAGKPIQDDELYAKVNSCTLILNDYFDVSQEFEIQYSKMVDKSLHDQIIAINEFLANNPQEYFAYQILSNAYFETGNYQKAIEALEKANKLKPKLADNYYMSLAGIYRQMGKFEEAYSSLNKISKENKENFMLTCAIARTKIKEKKYFEALSLLKVKAYADINNPYYDETITIAYHFNNMNTERDKLMEKNKDNQNFDYQFLIQIFSGKSKFYN